MTNRADRMPVVSIPGLVPDSPGHYLASLGLLRLLARTWPTVRIAWRDGVLHVVGGPENIVQVVEKLIVIAANGEWTRYERERWASAHKDSSALAAKPMTRGQSGKPFALWAATADEEFLELFTAHVVPTGVGRTFNPILGNAGAKGRRDFAKGWKRAVDALTKGASDESKAETASSDAAASSELRDELAALLQGKPTSWSRPDLNAGSWFSTALELYNTGQSVCRKEPLSPWLMAFACEGLVFLAGAASRRLGVRAARSSGAFPFVTEAAAPLASGEAGRDSAEFWAPLWDRPMTLPEVRTLFARGRAEIRGRGADTPSAFAAAIVRRGVDAGSTEFRRFVLGWTTAPDYAEPRLEGIVRLPAPHSASPASLQPTASVLSQVLDRSSALVERLPKEKKKNTGWQFVGLRGPIQKAMIDLAAAPEDPDAVRGLLDAIATALDRVDRNREFRKRHVAWKPLPVKWLPALFAGESPGPEARLALAFAGGFPRSRPLGLYRFGVERRGARFVHPERSPAQWSWAPGPLARVLASVLERRILDWEAAARREQKESPGRCQIPAMLDDVNAWLESTLDETLLRQWISRLALFDWSEAPRGVNDALALRGDEPIPVSGALALFGLLQPLFDLRPVHARDASRKLLDRESDARTPAAARRLASLVRTGPIDAAVRFARSRYAMGNAPLVREYAPWCVNDPERLLASVMFPVSKHDRTKLIERWFRPRRRQGDEAHV